MSARKLQQGQTASPATINVRLCPEEGQAELQTQLRKLAKEIASSLSALELAQSKELLGGFVSELFLSVAEQERQEYRRQKQAEGIAAAKARGVHFGPSPKPLPDRFGECCEAWQDGRMTASQAAEICGISKKTFYRTAARMKRDENCAAQRTGDRAV